MTEEIVLIKLDRLDPNPFQARLDYSESHLRDLARSMKEAGLIQPIVVRRIGDRYQVCVGWRRVLAARLAEMQEIPAIVRNLTDEDMAKHNLVENLRRRDFNVVERARGYKTMQETCDLTQDQVADVLGLSRDQVAQALRTLSFPPELQKLVSGDTITQTHAEALARLADSPAILQEAIKTVLTGHMTSKETESLVQHILEGLEIQKEIQAYLASPDFISTIVYLVPNAPEHKVCPQCDAPNLTYDKDECQTCIRCGWNEAAVNKLWELEGRISQHRLKRRGIKSWFEIHNTQCLPSCKLETPHHSKTDT